MPDVTRPAPAPESSRPRSISCIESLEPRRMFSSSYIVTDLGPVTGEFPYSPMTMNDQGQVIAGYGSMAYNPALYTNPTSTPLANLSRPLKKADVVAIDDAGDILGGIPGSGSASYIDPGDLFVGPTKVHYRTPDAFIFDGHHIHRFGPGYAVGRSANGDVLVITTKPSPGWADIVNGTLLNSGVKSLFVYSGHKRRQLQLPIPSSQITGAMMDDAGNVTVMGNGIYSYSPGAKTAVQISPVSLTSGSINSAGVIAGISPTGDFIIVDQGQATDLAPVPGVAAIQGVNSSHELVGHRSSADAFGLPDTTAIISHNGVIVDLESLAPPSDTGWTLQSANAINASGQIAAAGHDAQDQFAEEPEHYLLLTPVPPT